MRRVYRFVSCTVTLAFTLVFLPHSTASAEVWFVDLGNSSGTEDGTTWGQAFTTVQPAIDSAFADGGGEVWVAAGIYDEERESLLNRHDEANQSRLVNTGSVLVPGGVMLFGGFAGNESTRDPRDPGLNETILDGSTALGGQPALHVVVLAGDVTLDGFTITGGNARGELNGDMGGGVMAFGASPTISNCRFHANAAVLGDGVGVSGGTVSLFDSHFEDNEAVLGGGLGTVETTPYIERCTFMRNSAVDGGAIENLAATDGVIKDCSFEENESANFGGAICEFVSNTTIESCTFRSNTSTFGGGLHNYSSNVAVRECTFERNKAGLGGGMRGIGGSDIVVDNTVFWRNAATDGGHAIDLEESDLSLRFCTIAFNGPPIFGTDTVSKSNLPTAVSNRVESTLVVTNSILWPRNPPTIGIAIFTSGSSSDTVTNSIIRGGHAGAGNLDDDPLLADAAHGNLRIGSTSPARDSGVAVGGITTDILGIARPQGDAPDMGALEFVDADGDGMDDTWETEVGLNPTNPADAQLDGDGDTFTNVDEYEMGTAIDDGSDPPSRVYVATNGSDAAGFGSNQSPWRTIQFALDEVTHFATPANPVRVSVGAGLFDEKLLVFPNVNIEGEGSATTISFFNEEDFDDQHGVVWMVGKDMSLSHMAIVLPAVGSADISAVMVEGGPVHFSYMDIDGGFNLDSTGILLHGDGIAEDSTVLDSRFVDLRTAVSAIDTSLNLTRNLFVSIPGNAIELQSSKAGLLSDDGVSKTVLGDALRIVTTGLNRFRNVGDHFVANETNEVVLAKLNDWGENDSEFIREKLSPNVIFEPFVGIALVEGDIVLSLLDNATGLPIAPETGAFVSTVPNSLVIRDHISGIFVIRPSSPGEVMLTVSVNGFTEMQTESTSVSTTITPVEVFLIAGGGSCGALPGAETDAFAGGDLFMALVCASILALRGRSRRVRTPKFHLGHEGPARHCAKVDERGGKVGRV